MQEYTVLPPQSTPPNRQVMRMLFIALTITSFSAVVFAGGYFAGKKITANIYEKKLAQLDVKGVTEEKTYPLLKYSFSELEKRGGIASEIKLVRELDKNAEFTAYVFTYTSEGRKISGQLNIPASIDPNEQRPVIVLLRGYVDPNDYTIGKGSSPTAAALAKAGYITFAPDFLGFGESDPPPGETLAERFIKPMNVLDLFASIDSLDKQSLQFKNKAVTTIDAKRVGLWGHSNGGQIALSFLEISRRNIPTVLAAPVSKSFPYSVLFYTDEAEDQGKGLRGLLAKFEQDYNIEQFSIGNRLDDITAPIQLHQGSADVEVPKSWSDDFYSHFVGKGKKDQIEYIVHPGADHLLIPATDEVKAQAVAFFDKEVKFKQPEPTATITPSVTPELLENQIDATNEGELATPSATPRLQNR